MVKYILLGIVQGLTEFLPVSSSAHLIFAQKIMGITGEELVLSVLLHLGTAAALIVFFFKDILGLLRQKHLLLCIIIVTIITGIIGISGKDFFESMFRTPALASIALIITGIILILTKKFMAAKRDSLAIKDAFILGITQAIAIIPGISRSGMTISTLLFRGIDKETSFRFSFLASIPAVLGAALLEAKDINSICSMPDSKNFALGFIFSFLSGILALNVLKSILNKAKLYYFGYYCILVAIIALVFIK